MRSMLTTNSLATGRRSLRMKWQRAKIRRNFLRQCNSVLMSLSMSKREPEMPSLMISPSTKRLLSPRVSLFSLKIRELKLLRSAIKMTKRLKAIRATVSKAQLLLSHNSSLLREYRNSFPGCVMLPDSALLFLLFSSGFKKARRVFLLFFPSFSIHDFSLSMSLSVCLFVGELLLVLVMILFVLKKKMKEVKIQCLTQFSSRKTTMAL
mmetsp:Transcript_24870/g.28386  ORF Transcript_24870/g.28386 Transcript_24870/m.28386 type:complete len:208 (+) Transcript_24870:341-964(+)